MLIGIDASTVATGFAFGGVKDGRPKNGVWKGLGASDLVFDRTLASMSESLSLLIRATRAERVCIEAPLLVNDSQHGAHVTMALIQLTGALRSAAYRAGAQVKLVAVSTVRAHFIGAGHLGSKEAKAAVQRRCDQLGWSYVDDNAADANAVWCWGMSTFYPAWAPNGTPLFAEKSA
jgi:Holliday junction resolvasome RuvABC endonuclease subunit